MPRAALIVFRMPPRKVLTFFLEGLMSSFPFGYLRTFCPRKSKPFSTWVMTVFAGESSRPRSCRNCSTRGLISPGRCRLLLDFDATRQAAIDPDLAKYKIIHF